MASFLVFIFFFFFLVVVAAFVFVLFFLPSLLGPFSASRLCVSFYSSVLGLGALVLPWLLLVHDVSYVCWC